MELQKPKILYGITKSNFGGAQRYVFDLVTAVNQKGYTASVLCGGNGSLVQKLKEKNIPVISLPNLVRDISIVQDLKSFFFIYKILITEKPDVFHINSSKMGLGALAGRLAGTKKIIFTSHGWAFNEPRVFWQKFIIKFAVWLTITLSHKTICVSEKTKNDVKNFPFIKNKLEVIRNGVSSFNLIERKDKTFTVGTLAELHKIKGLDVLLTAWSRFIKNTSAKLIVIGEGGERKNLENMALNMGISNSVIFRGFIENAKSNLSEFDIFVLASRSEGMPYALLEAGIAGLPVISTSVGGIPEVIENEVNGLLIPKEDSKALELALEKLRDNDELRRKLGENLKKTIQEKFSLENMVRDTIKMYV